MVKNPSLFHDLKKKWGSYEKKLHKELWDKHDSTLSTVQNTLRHVVVGSLATLLSVTQPAATSIIAQGLQPEQSAPQALTHTSDQLIAILGATLPPEVDPLTPEREKAIEEKLSEYFGL